MPHPLRFVLRPLLAGFLLLPSARAWDYEGHRLVNQAALAALPAEFPDFARAPEAAERIAYLGGAPDRWRNNPDPPVRNATNPDHYFDLEYIGLAGLKLEEISDLRHVYAVQFATGRAARVAAFPPLDPVKNADRTQEMSGFLPWTITEHQGKLASAFSCLRVYRELGTPAEIANAEADVIQAMGVLGHYVGDSAQPLHTTMHHNGWVGDNPRDFSRWPGLHAWIDGGFIAKAGIGLAHVQLAVKPASAWALQPAAPGGRDPMFEAVLAHLAAQHARVLPLYELEKAGAFKAEVAATSVEGRAFVVDSLRTGAQALADLWWMAWKHAAPDVYLRTRLLQRKNAAAVP